MSSSERTNISLTALYIGVPILLGASCYYFYVSRNKDPNTKKNGDKKAVKKLSPLEHLTQLKQTGNKNFSMKNYETAIDHYTKAIEFSQTLESQLVKDDDMAIFYQNRAACQEALGNYEKVISDCDKAIDLKRNYTKAYIRRAKANEKLEQYDKAMVDAFSANLLEKFQNPSSMTLTENMVKESSQRKAVEAMKTHKPSLPSNQAIKSYFSAFTYDPIKEKYLDVAFTCAEQLQPIMDEAEKPENDNDPISLLIRGSCQTLIGEVKVAQELFDKLLALEDEVCSPRIKANALIKKAAAIISDPSNQSSSMTEELDQAHELLDRAVKIDPENPDVFLHKAQTYILSERLDEAVTNLDKAIELKKDFYSAIAQKFYIEFKLATRDSVSHSKLQDLLEKFKTAVEQNPEAKDLQLMHAQVLTDMSYFEQADQILLELTKQDPSDSNVVVTRALLQFHLKSDPDAVAILLQEALKIDPKIIFAYEILGSIENQRGKFDEAIKIFETAVKHAQSESEYARCFSLLESAIAQKKAAELLGVKSD